MPSLQPQQTKFSKNKRPLWLPGYRCEGNSGSKKLVVLSLLDVKVLWEICGNESDSVCVVCTHECVHACICACVPSGVINELDDCV